MNGRSALTSTGSGTGWRRIRAAILARDGHRCGYCGDRADTVDHRKPRHLGGDDRPSNLVACCRRCQTPSRRPDLQRRAPSTPSYLDFSLPGAPRSDRDRRATLIRGDYGRGLRGRR